MCVCTWVSSRDRRDGRAGSSRPPSAGTSSWSARAQRQPLAQRRLVDLDRERAGASRSSTSSRIASAICVQVSLARLVVAHERPLEDRDRAGEHPLHRLVGERLRVPPPAHGHRRRARHVAVEDRRLHAAAAVGLHPAVRREREARRAARPKYSTMSLRSGSPCTSTSRPSCSWSAIAPRSARARNARSRRSSSAPARRSRRAARISSVCGNEPIVVVGRSGSGTRARCALAALGRRRGAS